MHCIRKQRLLSAYGCPCAYITKLVLKWKEDVCIYMDDAYELTTNASFHFEATQFVRIPKHV